MEAEQNIGSSATPSPLSEMLSALLSNPELMEGLKGAMQSAALQNPTTEQNASAENDKAIATNVNPQINTDGLATVLSNPELMTKLPSIMATLKPMMEGNKEKKSDHAHKKSSEDCRNELLCALKPFLSPERRNAVDAMLRISQLGSVLKHIK